MFFEDFKYFRGDGYFDAIYQNYSDFSDSSVPPGCEKRLEKKQVYIYSAALQYALWIVVSAGMQTLLVIKIIEWFEIGSLIIHEKGLNEDQLGKYV